MDHGQAIDHLDWHYIEEHESVEPDTEDALIADEETVPDPLAALEALVAEIEACETVVDWWLLPSGDAMRQAQRILKETEGTGE